ncbi:MAG TPA: tetratricopeptide repeat protein, partial [Phycisphaerae bacterium]|nr:tetratricopeptide repeat protein [Phycisphaerae bacterium]
MSEMDAEFRVRRAHELYQDGKWAEAAAELSAAITSDPARASWHFNLGLTYEAMDDFIQARESYDAAVQLDGEDIEILNRLGLILT